MEGSSRERRERERERDRESSHRSSKEKSSRKSTSSSKDKSARKSRFVWWACGIDGEGVKFFCSDSRRKKVSRESALLMRLSEKEAEIHRLKVARSRKTQ